MTEPPVPPIPPSPSYLSPPASPLPASPAVRIGDWLQEAWRILQPVWLESVGTILVMGLVLLVGYALCFLPGLVIVGPLIAGANIYFAKRLLGLPAALDDVFKGFRRFGDTFLVGLVLYLVPMLINLALAIPRILAAVGTDGDYDRAAGPLLALTGGLAGLGYLFSLAYKILANTFLIFAMPLVLFRQMTAIDAMRRSVEWVKPQLPAFLVLLVVCHLVGMAGGFGFCLLCVGALVTIPLAWSLINLVQLQAYRELVGLTPADLAPYMD
jgi:uncharacterized membrane protein